MKWEYSLVKIPEDHYKIMSNMSMNYPNYPNLTKKCVFVGKEFGPDTGNVWLTESVWIFEWREPNGVADVAAIATLRVIGNKWSLEVSRMDGGDGALKIWLEYKGKKFENIYTQLGYGELSGDI